MARTQIVKTLLIITVFVIGVIFGRFLFNDNNSEIILKNIKERSFPIYIVPNIVHYVLFTFHQINFAHFISLLSVLKNQKPEKIYFHCDCHEVSGDYYQRVVRIANKMNVSLIIRNIERESQIFGKNLSKEFFNWHLSDITRNKVLQEFGGIYLDRDVYVVKSLDEFRKYEMTLDWDEGQPLGTQTLIAHKNARFLKLWLDSYHDYHPELWYYNAGELPTKKYLNRNPELVHRVKGQFGAEGRKICPLLFSKYYMNWRQDFYAIHLFIRGNEIPFKDWCFGEDIPIVTKFNESIASKLNVTFGEMTRDLFDFEKSFSQ